MLTYQKMQTRANALMEAEPVVFICEEDSSLLMLTPQKAFGSPLHKYLTYKIKYSKCSLNIVKRFLEAATSSKTRHNRTKYPKLIDKQQLSSYNIFLVITKLLK